MRLLWLALTLALLIIAVFLAWGGDFERWFAGPAAVEWIRGWGAWGWLAVITLLVSDLFLPVPATPVMSAAGYVYGFWIGGAISATGSFLAGLVAYLLCSGFGRRAAARIVGADDLARGERLFRERGPWLVALSRALPILPEVIACLAGLTRMPPRMFLLALACGSVPMGFIYAAIGASGQQRPGLAFALSALVPVVLWLVTQRLLRVHEVILSEARSAESKPFRQAQGPELVRGDPPPPRPPLLERAVLPAPEKRAEKKAREDR